MALNDPRTIPYAFRVFVSGGWVWACHFSVVSTTGRPS